MGRICDRGRFGARSEKVMDDESGEFTKRAELTEDLSPRWRDWCEVVGVEKHGVNFRHEVKHNKKTDQLFVKITMNVDGRG